MSKPKFFLSSTIYDFKDLRSAIKYYLEEQGCAVLASEFNDFPKPLDTHSYEACIQTIDKADYFILLIGSRVGGWYDRNSKISITQQEYRAAYEKHLKGEIKIITLIRDEIWTLREERKELTKYLETLNIDPGAKDEIRNHPSKLANDADFICNFISEICKNEDTKKALEDSSSPMPTGNWIHTFNSFRDVMDVIQTQAFKGIPVEHLTLRKLLLREIKETLRGSLVKYREGEIYSPEIFVKNFHADNKLSILSKDEEYLDIKVKYWDAISSLGISILGKKYKTLILQKSLESSVFLAFDSKTRSYREEPVYEALYLLSEQIELFNMAMSSNPLQVIFEHSKRARRPDAEVVSIKTTKILAYLHVMDRWVNIIFLCKAIIKHLNGEVFLMPELRPFSPIPDMNEQIEEERVTLDDVEKFVEK